MPTYEYVCTDCNNEWEEIQKISENALEVCPKCGKSTAKRQISAGNFILKGGGWYADLYSSTPKKGDTKSESSSTKSEASSSSGGASASTPSSGGASASTPSSGGASASAPAPSTGGAAK